MKIIKILLEIKCADDTRAHARSEYGLDETLRLASERQMDLVAGIVTEGTIPQVIATLLP